MPVRVGALSLNITSAFSCVEWPVLTHSNALLAGTHVELHSDCLP